MRTKEMKLEDINPAPYNPRVTLKKGDAEYEALTGSVDRFGLVVPLIVNERTGILVSGHQRLNALKEAGVTEEVVVLVDVDEETEKALNISLNKLSGDWDYEKLEELFKEFDAQDIEFTGFSLEELEGLFESAPTDAADTFAEDDDSAEEQGETQEDETPAKEFNVYISFPTKEAAERWLKGKGISEEYKGTSRNITIRMEGLEYGHQGD